MTLRSKNMIQIATYFPPTGQDRYGTDTFGPAQTVAVRWEDRAVLFRDAQAREVTSDAVVYCAQKIQVRGRLALGTVADPSEAREIRAVQISPSLRGNEQLLKALL